MVNCRVWVEITTFWSGSNCVGCLCGDQGTFYIRKYRCYYVLPPFYSTGHMAMNADLLKPGSDVFCLRGTDRVPATVVGLLFFSECIAIRYECSGPYPAILAMPSVASHSSYCLCGFSCLRALHLPTMWHLHRGCGSCSPYAGGVASLEWSGPLSLIPEATTSA